MDTLFDIKNEFPIFKKNTQLIYLDSAATTHKPQRVIDRMTQFYSEEYGTVHRAIYELSMNATDLYNSAREKVKEFINANSSDEIVFTRGTTDSINLVKNAFRSKIKRGDEIILSVGEHHSNMVPWQMLAEETGCVLKFIPLNDQTEIRMDAYEELLSERTKLVSIAHVFNSTGIINPIKEVIRLAHLRGAMVLVDGAQAISHLSVDVQDLDADFYAFSGHKMYGPTGIGVLFGKKEILQTLPPVVGGGDMVETVSLEKSTYKKPPLRFEAGTPMIAEVIGLKEAILFIEEMGLERISKEEDDLCSYLTSEMLKIEGLAIYGAEAQKTGIICFNIDGVHPLDLGTLLDLKGIAIRTGSHCAMPMHNRLGCRASARLSLSIYNTQEDVVKFITSLKALLKSL